jgi:hypothetical protein
MELQKILPAVLVLVLAAMVIGVGVLVLDKTGTDAAYNILNENVTVKLNNGTNVSLSHGNITRLFSVGNATNASQEVPSSNYTIWSEKGYIQGGEGLGANGASVFNNTNVAVYYEYKEYATAARTALYGGRDAVGGLSSNWMPLIVTIVALAIILGLVIGAFATYKKR